MERDDAPLADESQPGAVPNDMPSGLPDGEQEQPPLGGDDDGSDAEGTDAMPGIPDEDEPDVSG